MGTTSHFCWILQHQEETIFSLCWPLVLLHHVLNGFLFSSSHGFAISVRFQLTFFTRSRWAGPFFPPFLQTGSRKLWIQTIAHFPVRHNVTVTTQQFHWYRWVGFTDSKSSHFETKKWTARANLFYSTVSFTLLSHFKFEYPGKFKGICIDTLGCETETQ